MQNRQHFDGLGAYPFVWTGGRALCSAAAGAAPGGDGGEPPAPQRVDPDNSKPGTREQAAAEARAECHGAYGVLNPRERGTAADAELFAAALERDDPRALDVARRVQAAEIAAGAQARQERRYERGAPGAIDQMVRAAEIALDEQQREADTLRERLEAVDRDPRLTAQAKAEDREKIRRELDRSKSSAQWKRARELPDEREQKLLKGAAGGAADKRDLPELTAASLIPALALGDEAMARAVLSTLSAGHPRAALELLRTFEVTAEDPLRLRQTARMVQARSEAVAAAALFADREQADRAAELHALREARKGLDELIEDVRRRPEEVELLRGRLAKLATRWLST